MKIKLLLPCLFVITLFIGCSQQQGPSGADLNYPDTKKVDTVDTYFGTEVADPYRWLEDDNSEETEAGWKHKTTSPSHT